MIELLGQRSTGQSDAHSLAFFEADSQVLDEVFDVESRLEIPTKHSGAQFLHTEAASCSLRQKSDQLVELETSLMTVDQALAQTDHS
eukprot:CAMPEP_0170505228 /NCGR_PEP_ID=MMETSP0208-20121228/50225_1 /TAXON_ID=197538 /ORGANISM="Strombidium inclinatum, Strain S3" /LENGTH=86 /DNA_ID=CAMNT_0010785947 /DNA_START=19 /DNA_END=279 /DNA_ORIENTATION=-